MRRLRSRLLVVLPLIAVAVAAINRGSATSLSGPTTNLSNGITFEHAALNDPVRMVGEPDVYSDYKGGLYVSGPGGSTTQASWFWKSDDHGDQWHSIGVIPEGKSNGQNGGGDTEITIAKNNDVFASDLQTLQCNSVFRSFDEGKTFLTSEGCFPETDRQWMGIYDPNGSATGRRIYLAANGTVQDCYVLVSTDNGVTYAPPDPVGNPTADIGASCIGRLVVDPSNGHIFVPTSGGVTRVSTDGGLHWTARGDNNATGNFFANLAIDTAGNIWQGWTTSCSAPATNPCKAFVSYSTDRAVTWHAPIQVNTGAGSPAGGSPDLRQMLFPWTVVGDPGRVAIVYYATTDVQRNEGGYPGGPNAAWHAYASISTNAMDANPTFTQVQATEHVMHRGTVCTGGFPGCLLDNADRSMADFFAVERDPDGRLYIAYNENSDLSLVVPQPPEYIGKPINAVIRLRTGPSLFAAKGDLLPLSDPADVAITDVTSMPVLLSALGTHGLPPGNWATDPAGDAKFPVVPVEGPNQPALDVKEVSVAETGDNLTFKIKVASLSPAALAQAAALGTPSLTVTWWQTRGGIGPASVALPHHSHWFVKWLGDPSGNGFAYGRVSSIDAPALGAPTPKLMTYPISGAATGTINAATGEVTITVPQASLGGLADGDKLDHVTAYGFAEHAADTTFPSVVDQAKSFSYVVGTPASGQHAADGYVEVSLSPTFDTTTRATLNPDGTWAAQIPGAPPSGTVYARQVLAKDLYTPLWDDVQAGPVAQRSFGPTAVTVRSFSARRDGRAVTLRWRTAAETGLLGFHLYRDRTRLDRRLIPARGGTHGATYVWRDAKAPAKPVRYRLVEVRQNGARATHVARVRR